VPAGKTVRISDCERTNAVDASPVKRQVVQKEQGKRAGVKDISPRKPKVPDSSRRVRGRETRRRMLDALRKQLQERSIRDVKVVDIAESVGVTPAAFYQYFVDLEDALLALANEMVEDSRKLTELMAGDWQNDGRAVAKRVVDGFVEFWDDHEAVLRVVELSIDEHDTRFARIRSDTLNESVLALSFVIASRKAQGLQPDHVDPRAMAAGLSAALVHVSSRRWMYEAWGLEVEVLKASVADILYTMVIRDTN
jgi:AcrR family transcriptional regulator